MWPWKSRSSNHPKKNDHLKGCLRRFPRAAALLRFEPLEDRTVPTLFRAIERQTSPPLNVVLVSDAVAQADEVVSAATEGTIAVIYDSGTMTTSGLVDFLGSVSAAHNDARIGHLALVDHGS